MTNTDTKDIIDFPNQKTFLSDLTKKKASVTIFLINGVKLEGNLGACDDYCVFLSRDKITQLVYKHAIATVFEKSTNGSYRIPDGRVFRD